MKENSFCKRFFYKCQAYLVAASFLIAASLIFCLALVAVPQKIRASPMTPWEKAPYIYQEYNTPVKQVLKNFAKQFSIKIDFAEVVKGNFKGVMRAASPTQFLNNLGKIYGFQWFYYNGKLYIANNSDNTTNTFSISPQNMPEIKSMLNNMGLIDTQFSWSEIVKEGLVIVSGPKSYIKIIKSIINKFNNAPDDTEIAVIPLKYASVEDRLVPFRSSKIKVPGIVTILQQLIKRGPSGIPEDTNIKVNPKTIAAISSGVASDLVSVQGDARINAVIVKAPKSLIPIYKQLIKKLDIPSSLVEINVAIVDVDIGQEGKLGVSWTSGNNGASATYGNTSSNQNGSLGINWFGTPFGATASVSTGGGTYLLTHLNLMQSKGQAQVISKPSILTMNNMKAVFDLSRSFYILNSGVQTTSTTPVTAGLTLEVTPRIVNEKNKKYIQLWLNIEDGSIDDAVRIEGYPIINRNNISTVAMVGNNQSLLIAGNQLKTKQYTNGGVPILKDIPILGWLFKTRTSRERHQQRFFLITPRIVSLQDISREANQSKRKVSTTVDRLPYVLKPYSIDYALGHLTPEAMEKEAKKMDALSYFATSKNALLTQTQHDDDSPKLVSNQTIRIGAPRLSSYKNLKLKHRYLHDGIYYIYSEKKNSKKYLNRSFQKNDENNVTIELDPRLRISAIPILEPPEPPTFDKIRYMYSQKPIVYKIHN